MEGKQRGYLQPLPQGRKSNHSDSSRISPKSLAYRNLPAIAGFKKSGRNMPGWRATRRFRGPEASREPIHGLHGRVSHEALQGNHLGNGDRSIADCRTSFGPGSNRGSAIPGSASSGSAGSTAARPGRAAAKPGPAATGSVWPDATVCSTGSGRPHATARPTGSGRAARGPTGRVIRPAK